MRIPILLALLLACGTVQAADSSSRDAVAGAPPTAQEHSQDKSDSDKKTDADDDIVASLPNAKCKFIIVQRCFNDLQSIEIAAKEGTADFQFEVGVFYALGDEHPWVEHPQDYRSAFRWFSTGAKRGLSKAESQLGNLYWNGHGVIENWTEAARQFHLAAVKGDNFGQTMLCTAYSEGKGVQRDYVKAYMWCNIAIANYPYDWNISARDRLAAKMTTAQITESQGLARRCVESHYTDCGGD
jgi:hypothetical protein